MILFDILFNILQKLLNKIKNRAVFYYIYNLYNI